MEQQSQAIRILAAAGFDIENPDQPHHQAAGQERGIAYFADLVTACDAICFLRFDDGSIGAGVAAELDAARLGNLEIYEITEGILVRVHGEITGKRLSIKETRKANAGQARQQAEGRILKPSSDRQIHLRREQET